MATEQSVSVEAPTLVNIDVCCGALLSLDIPLVDDATGDSIGIDDVTGWTAQAVVRHNVYGPVLHRWSTTAGNLSIIAGPQARVELTATPEETALWPLVWPSLRAAWHVEITSAPSDPSYPDPVAAGIVTLHPLTALATRD